MLALDASGAACQIALLDADTILAQRYQTGARGHAVALPPMLDQVLIEAAQDPAKLDLIAVTVGPGSFTGLRAAISLAQGLALGADVKLVGVSVPEALRSPSLPGQNIWVALHARRGCVFLDQGNGPALHDLEALPMPGTPIAIAGDAAAICASQMTGRGHEVTLLDRSAPDIARVAQLGRARAMGGGPPLPAQPLYGEAPRVTTAPALVAALPLAAR